MWRLPPTIPAEERRPHYGLMLTAWGFGSVFGRLLIAHLKQTTKVYSGALPYHRRSSLGLHFAAFDRKAAARIPNVSCLAVDSL